MTAWPDLVNGAFELGLGLLQWLNCRQLWRDREVKGVDWRVTAFCAAWGVWNLFYYPYLVQWLSFVGGLFVVSANVVWVCGAMKFLSIRNQHVAGTN